MRKKTGCCPEPKFVEYHPEPAAKSRAGTWIDSSQDRAAEEKNQPAIPGAGAAAAFERKGFVPATGRLSSLCHLPGVIFKNILLEKETGDV